MKDLRKPESDFVPLVYGVEGHTQAENIGDRFFLMTDSQAPNGRIVEAAPGGEPSQWKPVIAEGKNVIDSFSIVGGKLFVSRLKDVKTETTIYTLEGKETGTLSLSGDRLGISGVRTLRADGGLLYFRVVHPAVDDLSIRH